MNESIQESIDKTEKLAVDSENPKYLTNWCDLPLEMRAECIKRMDFETRTRLGATSHTEKSLVDAKKYHFEFVFLVYTNEETVEENLKVIAEQVEVESFDNHEKTLSFLVKILKSCEIDIFELFILENLDTEQIWAKIEECAPFRFKTFKSNAELILTQNILKNCTGLETVMWEATSFENATLFDLINTPVVINAKFFQTKFYDRYVLQGFVEELLNAPPDIPGNDVFVWRLGFIHYNASKFENRLIYKKDNEIRLRSNDESKHIVLRKNREYICSFYSCTVIPSSLLESEYGECEWFKELIDNEDDEPFFEDDSELESNEDDSSYEDEEYENEDCEDEDCEEDSSYEDEA